MKTIRHAQINILYNVYDVSNLVMPAKGNE